MNATELPALADLATVLAYCFVVGGIVTLLCAVFQRGSK